LSAEIPVLPQQAPTAQVALRTLGQLAKSTGYVIKPYMRYPKLLDILLMFLKTEQVLAEIWNVDDAEKLTNVRPSSAQTM
jgi:FKBP12-rapamycin complex-associated protein